MLSLASLIALLIDHCSISITSVVPHTDIGKHQSILGNNSLSIAINIASISLAVAVGHHTIEIST